MEQETVTNTPTPSRTIRLNSNGDYNVSVNHGVTQAENGRRFLTFTNVDDAIIAYSELKDSDIKASFLTYSLFVKSQDELTQEALKTQVLKLVPDVNVTYIRVDDNKHTGKIVVDLLTNYQLIKSASDDKFRFFHFDPKRVKPRREFTDNRLMKVPSGRNYSDSKSMNNGRNNGRYQEDSDRPQRVQSGNERGTGRGAGRDAGRGAGRSSGRFQGGRGSNINQV